MKTLACLIAGLGLLLAVNPAWARKPHPGAELAGRLGCFACHSLAGRGGTTASGLDGLGSQLLPDQIEKILLQPRMHNPQARMPSYPQLRPHELQSLINYLMRL
ncbi:MAG: cytochrome c [Thermodesulfobacteriota bacterium]